MRIFCTTHRVTAGECASNAQAFVRHVTTRRCTTSRSLFLVRDHCWSLNSSLFTPPSFSSSTTAARKTQTLPKLLTGCLTWAERNFELESNTPWLGIESFDCTVRHMKLEQAEESVDDLGYRNVPNWAKTASTKLGLLLLGCSFCPAARNIGRYY